MEANGETGDEKQAGVLFAEAAISLAEGAPQEAVNLYREGRALVPKCYLCGLPELGEYVFRTALTVKAQAEEQGLER